MSLLNPPRDTALPAADSPLSRPLLRSLANVLAATAVLSLAVLNERGFAKPTESTVPEPQENEMHQFGRALKRFIDAVVVAAALTLKRDEALRGPHTAYDEWVRNLREPLERANLEREAAQADLNNWISLHRSQINKYPERLQNVILAIEHAGFLLRVLSSNPHYNKKILVESGNYLQWVGRTERTQSTSGER